MTVYVMNRDARCYQAHLIYDGTSLQLVPAGQNRPSFYRWLRDLTVGMARLVRFKVDTEYGAMHRIFRGNCCMKRFR